MEFEYVDGNMFIRKLQTSQKSIREAFLCSAICHKILPRCLINRCIKIIYKGTSLLNVRKASKLFINLLIRNITSLYHLSNKLNLTFDIDERDIFLYDGISDFDSENIKISVKDDNLRFNLRALKNIRKGKTSAVKTGKLLKSIINRLCDRKQVIRQIKVVDKMIVKKITHKNAYDILSQCNIIRLKHMKSYHIDIDEKIILDYYHSLCDIINYEDKNNVVSFAMHCLRYIDDIIDTDLVYLVHSAIIFSDMIYGDGCLLSNLKPKLYNRIDMPREKLTYTLQKYNQVILYLTERVRL